MIKQADLVAYLRLKEEAAASEKALAEARGALIARKAEPVQKGQYGLKVELRESRRFSYVAIVDAIGKLQADRIKQLLPLSPSTYMTVTGA